MKWLLALGAIVGAGLLALAPKALGAALAGEPDEANGEEMPDVQLKFGVVATGVQPEIVLALQVADRLWQERGDALVVTSLRDGEHCDQSQGRPCPDGRAHSLHYDGLAADLRSRHLAAGEVSSRVAELRSRLGPLYQVIAEPSHIHVEFDGATMVA
ncbi:MAG TPA: hypothetical protein VGR44_12120 [Methylomirabilota bacterium]|jgi:hypothetical protein|nr:hypothetical protein [Methylomirabilota bacterium]